MKAYKIEILVIDHENMGLDEIKSCIESTPYIYPRIMNIQEADVGEWTDDHPLNKSETSKQEYDRLFTK